MPIDRPYFRSVRPGPSGQDYVLDPRFGSNLARAATSYLLIQKDLLEIFDFVEPTASNAECVSFRIHALLMRICMDVEASCKGILVENGFALGKSSGMIQYQKIELSHRLSEYKVQLPRWGGVGALRQPFKAWGEAEKTLPWYKAYNQAKHNVHADITPATFNQLIEACCGLVALLYSQVSNHDFFANDYSLTIGPADGSHGTVGGYFRIYEPTWSKEDQYDFDWSSLKAAALPFQKFTYPE